MPSHVHAKSLRGQIQSASRRLVLPGDRRARASGRAHQICVARAALNRQFSLHSIPRHLSLSFANHFVIAAPQRVAHLAGALILPLTGLPPEQRGGRHRQHSVSFVSLGGQYTSHAAEATLTTWRNRHVAAERRGGLLHVGRVRKGFVSCIWSTSPTRLRTGHAEGVALSGRGARRVEGVVAAPHHASAGHISLAPRPPGERTWRPARMDAAASTGRAPWRSWSALAQKQRLRRPRRAWVRAAWWTARARHCCRGGLHSAGCSAADARLRKSATTKHVRRACLARRPAARNGRALERQAAWARQALKKAAAAREDGNFWQILRRACSRLSYMSCGRAAMSRRSLIDL